MPSQAYAIMIFVFHESAGINALLFMLSTISLQQHFLVAEQIASLEG